MTRDIETRPDPRPRQREVAAKIGLGSTTRHIFLCCDQTVPKCCDKDASLASWAHLKKRLRELGLSEAGGVARTKANCLRICHGGPIAVVYPEGTWYGGCTPDVIDRILEEHVLGGRPVEEHRIADRRLDAPPEAADAAPIDDSSSTGDAGPGASSDPPAGAAARAAGAGDAIAATEAHVRAKFEGEGTGHDWWHVDRVRRTAVEMAAEEGADRAVVELAALLHDIADWKFHDGDPHAGSREARTWLEGCGVDAGTIDHVCAIVDGVSFKGAGVDTPMETIEGRVVQDADRLDALGAIGVARTFAYGGHKGQPLHDPESEPEPHDSFEAYKSGGGSSIAHFHEKLLLLKDRMLTDSGRRRAAERHAFLETFLDRFRREWDGRA